MSLPQLPEGKAAGAVSTASRRHWASVGMLPAVAFLLCHCAVGELCLVSARAADPTLHNDYAASLVEQGKYAQAVEQLEKAYGLFSLNPTLKENLATAYTLLGQQLLDKKSFAQAAEQFGKAVELYPDNPRYHLLRGIALTFAQNYDPARYELETARGLAGDGVEVLYFLGKTYYDVGETDRALEYWEKAAALAPDDPRFVGLLERMRREQAAEGKMDRGYSSRFVISYDTEVRTGSALDILDALEHLYNEVGTDLDYYPEAKIPVILYTLRDYREVTRSPHWSGGLYDGKIRLPIGGMTELTPELRATLRHEYTHAVVRDLTRGNCPSWLNEGIAELQGRQEFNPPLTELGRVIRTGDFIPLHALEGNFSSLGEKQIRLAYEESYAAVNYLVTTYGWYRVKAILLNLGEGMTIEQALTRGLADFTLTYDDFSNEWRDAMKREFTRTRK